VIKVIRENKESGGKKEIQGLLDRRDYKALRAYLDKQERLVHKVLKAIKENRALLDLLD